MAAEPPPVAEEIPTAAYSTRPSRAGRRLRRVILVLFLVAVAAPGGVPPFIYFQF